MNKVIIVFIKLKFNQVFPSCKCTTESHLYSGFIFFNFTDHLCRVLAMSLWSAPTPRVCVESIAKQVVCGIINYTHIKQWGVISHSCPNFNGGLVKLPLKSSYGSLIFYILYQTMYVFIVHAQSWLVYERSRNWKLLNVALVPCLAQNV